ncbi:NUDIX domain-containing protein [Nitratireductor aquibiodomus]|uniref:NUDIX domain-containing protein n=1 Tax=Nitratireductor aquibiodomus TaxID=204799 RepID=UPI0019D3991C|nr:NUDIX domain-containing protein [Nitratireductor aquibiodomus]MBN7759742.1 NUDIX domain-containing protein [Nitratireductor aquibiodomus]
MTDQPIGHTPDGRPIYDNAPTVVAVLAYVNAQPMVVRRNNNPGRGLLALPGGYQMRGETWQEAGCREVFEETGWKFDPTDMQFISMATDEYGNNLVIAENGKCLGHLGEMDRKEVQEIRFISHPGDPKDWAFPRHYEAARSEYYLMADD